jgi:hypothetical protein
MEKASAIPVVKGEKKQLIVKRQVAGNYEAQN